jgi:peptidoglycan endopeptidase LytE
VKSSLFASAFIFILLITFNAYAGQTYTVKKGDSLYKIARKFKVEQEKIREANGLDTIKLRPGQRLTIPSGDPGDARHAPNEEAAAANSRKKMNPLSDVSRVMSSEHVAQPESLYHTVKKGDTLASISRKYSIPLKELKELNDLGKSSRLKPGRQIILKKTGPRTYTVRKGDTITKIARKFGVSGDDLRELNELESDELKPGQKLLLEEWVEQPEVKNYAMLSHAKISDDIKTLAESPELNSLDMKDRLMLFAKKMLNIPYRFGGSTFMGIDCSGYVQKVFGFLDVSLPRTAREQFLFGEPVSKEDLSMGDLVFFRTYASFPSHVGIYLGNNLFIHASSRSRKVSIDSLDTPYYIKRFIGAKRLFEEEFDTATEFNEKS